MEPHRLSDFRPTGSLSRRILFVRGGSPSEQRESFFDGLRTTLSGVEGSKGEVAERLKAAVC